MTNQEILSVAMRQSAIDSGCDEADFLSEESKVVLSRAHPDARRYLELPFECDMTSYGAGIVASVSPQLAEVVRGYIARYSPVHCFETPNLNALIDAVRPRGLGVCFMAEYFLPDVTALKALECPYATRLLTPEDFAPLYLPQWSNALCERRSHLDKLAVGAYDGDELIGLAGASADCEGMWQIGIDVLPAYRRRGVAASLTSQLAAEILKKGIVPFYCCAWSNVASARNAIRSGFRPAWVQVTLKAKDFIDKMNE